VKKTKPSIDVQDQVDASTVGVKPLTLKQKKKAKKTKKKEENYMDETDDEVRRVVAEPSCRHLRPNELGLTSQIYWSFNRSI
jgi:hypothetical protein